MRMPVISGTIDRRILLSYRVDPEMLARQLPAMFRPRLHRGRAIVGLCLIRLRHVRPKMLPAWLGLSSENIAHRAAVEWDTPDGPRNGVFIWRRDSDSRLNQWAGGRVFPGVHGRAAFDVREGEGRHEITVTDASQRSLVKLAGVVAGQMPPNSVFDCVDDASHFFQQGAVGYSPGTHSGHWDGIRLDCQSWQVTPLAIEYATSEYFDDPAIWPPGSIELDSALLMTAIEHEWHAESELCCTA